MWVGSIPTDATKAELRQVFSSSTGLPNNLKNTVLSVHLISRSHCAFVNYNSQTALEAAVSYFNGRPCRPQQPRCPEMSCRISKKEDEPRVAANVEAGSQREVGMQREIGAHLAWVKELKALERDRVRETDPNSGNVFFL
jgi:RNA recognition motif-containing protein